MDDATKIKTENKLRQLCLDFYHAVLKIGETAVIKEGDEIVNVDDSVLEGAKVVFAQVYDYDGLDKLLEHFFERILRKGLWLGSPDGKSADEFGTGHRMFWLHMTPQNMLAGIENKWNGDKDQDRSNIETESFYVETDANGFHPGHDGKRWKLAVWEPPSQKAG